MNMKMVALDEQALEEYEARQAVELQQSWEEYEARQAVELQQSWEEYEARQAVELQQSWEEYQTACIEEQLREFGHAHP